MDINELFSCCRSGDLEKIRFLVEQRDIDVNIRDRWDSTPLYYACLCGHTSVVEYLIGAGARCEANTFDGERCLYGALTDEIRRMLTQHNLITAHTIRRDAYNEFLRRLYESGEESDVTLIVHEKEFDLHRCILAARSPYFCEKFSSKWKHRERVVIKNDMVDPAAFECVIRYIYTGRLECPFELTDLCLAVGINCKLPMFRQLLDEAIQRVKFLQLEKQGRVRITTVVIEPEDCLSVSVDSDLRELAQTTLPPELRVWPTEMPFCQREMPALADVCFVVEGLQFMCHKMFFCPRSEYFRALFRDHFHETEWVEEPLSTDDFSLPTLTLYNFSAKVFTVIVTYLYCNQIMVDDEATVVEVLYAADMCLLDGLKRQCGVFLGTRLSVANVFFIHRLGRLFNLLRLEDQCVAFVARNFAQVAEQDQLREIILSDAHQVKGRQETDSITFVDELRFHMTSNLCEISDIVEAKDRLSLLEEILEDLGIEA